MNLTRQEKHLYRKKMLQIMRGRSLEELTDEELAEVQAIGRYIGCATMDESKPLQKMAIETFTYEDYCRLLELEYSVKAIKKALGVSNIVFSHWREQNIPKQERVRYRKSKTKSRIIVVCQDGEILTQGTCEDLSHELGLKPSTIYSRVKKERPDRKKRTFRYLEVEK